MRVIVDGNNLLHAARAAQSGGPLLGRSLLCDAIGQWASQRGHAVHVVFDGPAPTEARARQIGHPEIDITFSGPRTADAEVIDRIDNDSGARHMLVVSTDREVAQAARRRRARSIRADEFWALLELERSQRPRRPSLPQEKQHGLSPEATEQWLREFGIDEADARIAEDGAA